MIKLIASDLDETLLGPGSRVVEENLRAIKKCQELGIKFVPATGRGFYSLRQTLEWARRIKPASTRFVTTAGLFLKTRGRA